MSERRWSGDFGAGPRSGNTIAKGIENASDVPNGVLVLLKVKAIANQFRY